MSDTSNQEQVYAFGYSQAAVGMMESRSAEMNASFFLEHLEPGMQVLDVGCGPGAITVGLAAAVSPGQVIGIDIEPSQVALGRERAAAMGLDNCRFEVGSVFDLPLGDQSVDCVFGHTILMQFSDLEPVLAELKRVLKRDGVVGFREIDFGASLYHSETSALRTVMETLRRSIRLNDGNPDIGHVLPGILSGAGFEIVRANATYACAPTPKAKLGTYAAMTRLWQQADFVERAVSLGWLNNDQRDELVRQLEKEAHDPKTFNASTYVEVVARFSKLEAEPVVQ